MRTYVDVAVMLEEPDRFDFNFPDDGPGRPAFKLRVESVTLMIASQGSDRRGVRISGTRYRQGGERGSRRWSGAATLDEMPPHVLEEILRAKELLP